MIRSKGKAKFYFEKVPQNRINDRLQDPPQLRGPTIEILGIGEETAAGDIVLSSAGKYSFINIATRPFETIQYLGWASVQCSRDQYVIFDVMTPDGLGIHLRQPAILKSLFHLRGSQIEQTPFFSKHSYEEDQNECDDDDDDDRKQSNELEMIINEKLWKGEQVKHRRRAKRT